MVPLGQDEAIFHLMVLAGAVPGMEKLMPSMIANPTHTLFTAFIFSPPIGDQVLDKPFDHNLVVQYYLI
jgi:hypothetical protein